MRRNIAVFSGARQLSLAILVILGSSAIGTPVHLKKVGEGYLQPVDVVWAPGAPDAMYVVEQSGRIWKQDRSGKKTVWLDIRKHVASGGEMGLLSLAFHPQFAKNRRYFLNYTVDGPRATRVVERTEGKNEEKERIGFAQPYSNHNGGHLLFGPDGLLYIATGDGGSAGDPENRAQNLGTLLGKILRIDVDNPKSTIPKDNPFQGKGQRGEIYAYGMRNPWRMSFDPKTKELWTGDVGQNRYEEIDVITKGGNYGWRLREATHCFLPPRDCPTANLIDPVFEYGRDEGISITGGLVYRGKKVPDLVGKYLYADYVSGKLWALDADVTSGVARKNQLLLDTKLQISSFGVDPEGEAYVVHHGGAIYRITSGSGS